MKFLRAKRGLIAIIAALLILFLFRPGVRQLRGRIAGSIGSALGRRVTLDNVRVHFLPRPGFDLEGLVIYDDPAFSDEPMVRAQEVSAAIRIRSLFRGRLEIATLSATEPSINLVRNDSGRWNLASLVERSAHIATAPTGKAGFERPAFPYLEATHARINFKIGQTKKSWALSDAEVALWQDSENTWGARMRAQPVRTDFNLTDTGLVQVNATWQRAETLSQTPVQVTVQWEKGQLGQITKLLSGRDRGWRGGVSFGTTLSGTPKALQVKTQIRIDDFHRYDIMGNGSVRLSTVCSGRYSTADSLLQDLACESPVGGGLIRVRGAVGPIAPTPGYNLIVEAEKVPLPSLLQLLRQAKKELPADLTATGRVDAEFRAIRGGSGPMRVSGSGIAENVRLSSNAGKDEITLGDVPLVIGTVGAHRPPSKSGANENASEPTEAHLKIGPFPLGMGASSPATAGGWVSGTGYRFTLRGDTQLQNVFRLANTLGVPGFRPVAQGSAKVDLSVTGEWRGFAAPATSGTAYLRNVRTGMRALNPPIDIASATLELQPDRVSLGKIIAQTDDTRWTGWVKAPRPCEPAGCVFQFELAANQLSSGGFTDWFTPQPRKRPWYRILASGDKAGPSPLLAIRAKGAIRIGKLSLHKVDISQVTARVDLGRGKVTLSDLHGQMFQGMHQGKWIIDASTQPPRYQGEGTLQGISLAQVSTAMNDSFATGTADARFELVTSGATFSELLSHADGELKFVVQDGSLAHIELPEAPKPFPIHHFAAGVKVNDGIWNVSAGKLESHDGIYQISGTASPGGGLNIVLTRGDDQSWNVTGTLRKPHVVHANRTQAKTLKP